MNDITRHTEDGAMFFHGNEENATERKTMTAHRTTGIKL